MLNLENQYEQGLVGPIIGARSTLKKRFLWEPFSYWDTQQGAWQDRRRAWVSLGLQSELGREDGLTYKIPEKLSDGSKGRKVENQTSVFDPCVCELCYHWWCPPGGIVLDPFAGGSVRGIIASLMGLKYWGCELRAEQVAANIAQAVPGGPLVGQYRPKWVQGDSMVTVPAQAPQADFILSCPPYGNLEVYSQDPADISNKGWGEFCVLYTDIIMSSMAKLRDNSFACWVVSNFRDKATGEMHDFVGTTVQAFARGGAMLYNDIILINANGSGPMRANGTFQRGARKVVKLHQNVLVFCKGDPKLAAAKLADVAAV